MQRHKLYLLMPTLSPVLDIYFNGIKLFFFYSTVSATAYVVKEEHRKDINHRDMQVSKIFYIFM